MVRIRCEHCQEEFELKEGGGAEYVAEEKVKDEFEDHLRWSHEGEDTNYDDFVRVE